MYISEILKIPNYSLIEAEPQSKEEETAFIVIWDELQIKPGLPREECNKFAKKQLKRVLDGEARFRVVDPYLDILGNSVLKLLLTEMKDEEMRYFMVQKTPFSDVSVPFIPFEDFVQLMTYKKKPNLKKEIKNDCSFADSCLEYHAYEVIGKYLEEERIYDIRDQSWQEEVLSITKWHYFKK